jgi:hypothetical protein
MLKMCRFNRRIALLFAMLLSFGPLTAMAAERIKLVPANCGDGLLAQLRNTQKIGKLAAGLYPRNLLSAVVDKDGNKIPGSKFRSTAEFWIDLQPIEDPEGSAAALAEESNLGPPSAKTKCGAGASIATGSVGTKHAAACSNEGELKAANERAADAGREASEQRALANKLEADLKAANDRLVEEKKRKDVFPLWTLLFLLVGPVGFWFGRRGRVSVPKDPGPDGGRRVLGSIDQHDEHNGPETVKPTVQPAETPAEPNAEVPAHEEEPVPAATRRNIDVVPPEVQKRVDRINQKKEVVITSGKTPETPHGPNAEDRQLEPDAEESVAS